MLATAACLMCSGVLKSGSPKVNLTDPGILLARSEKLRIGDAETCFKFRFICCVKSIKNILSQNKKPAVDLICRL